MNIISGLFNESDIRVGIIASRFNEVIVSKLIDGAADGLARHGVDMDKVDLAWVPGAFEIPLVALEAFERLHTELGLPPVVMHVNNRKLAEGFYRGLGVEDTASVLQRVDKFDKIGPVAVAELLTGELGLSAAQADA